MTLTDAFFVMFLIGGLFAAGYGTVLLLGLLIDRLKGKRPYDGRFRVGVIL
jgi:hypothetical protein